MTFLAPWFLAVGALAALGVVAAHLLALQRPPVAPLPTARFVPDVPARAMSRADRPVDRWLLLLRVLAVLCLAAAFARPVPEPSRAAERRVIVLDRSRAVGSVEALREAALARFRPGDAVVLVDSVARALAAPTADSLRAITLADARGSVSAGLVAAMRTAQALRDSTDSVRVVLVSPLVAEQVDAATRPIRALWTAALDVERLPAATDPEAAGATAAAPVEVRAPADDALAVAIDYLGPRPAAQPARVVREAPTAADSAWVRERGGLLVVWPDSATPPGWSARDADTVGAVTTGDVTLVAPFARAAAAPEGAVARAWWADGAVAASESPLGAGCVRTVAVPTAGSGDLALRPRFHGLVGALLVPCGGARDLAPVDESALAALRGDGAATVALRADAAERSPLVPWLLGAALALLLAELAVRQRGASA